MKKGRQAQDAVSRMIIIDGAFLFACFCFVTERREEAEKQRSA